jgi:hypothetical protein
MSKSQKTYIFWLCCIAVLAASFFAYAVYLENKCEDAGGVRLRTVIGSWKCYDAKSLKELAP